MPETVYASPFDGIAKWRWHDVMNDLVEQGGLEPGSVCVNPFSVQSGSCQGTYKDDPFVIFWVPDKVIIVSMITYSQKLVDAFSAVFGYEPWIRYQINYENGISLQTIEWMKEIEESSYETIMSNPRYSDVKRLT